VFDAYAGPGAMYSGAWCHAKQYVGCDKEFYNDSRLMYCADSARVMRAIDLSAFNVFDFDAFGSPYELALILAARRKVFTDEVIGIVLTDGTSLTINFNSVPTAVIELAGLSGRNLSGAGANADFIFERMIRGLARRMGCSVEKRWEARGKTGQQMRYSAIMMEGK